VPEAAEFLIGYFRGYYKLCEIIFCQGYYEGSSACDEVQFVDEEPTRALARSMYTHCWELFTKFLWSLKQRIFGMFESGFFL
jgi:hypothetical protein